VPGNEVISVIFKNIAREAITPENTSQPNINPKRTNFHCG
jgi:hypothetical protein